MQVLSKAAHLLPRVQVACGSQSALHNALRGVWRVAGPGPGVEGRAKVGQLDSICVPDCPPRGAVLPRSMLWQIGQVNAQCCASCGLLVLCCRRWTTSEGNVIGGLCAHSTTL